MFYLMLTVWCFFIYVTGRGLYRMWTSVIGGAVVDWLMLPATLLSELLYSGGRLMTGRPVYAGIIAPQNASSDPCRVAISGKNGFWVEMLSAFLAMAGAWLVMLLVCKQLSAYVLDSVSNWPVFLSFTSLPKNFPTSWGDVWDYMQYLCGLVEHVGDVLSNQDYTSWEMLVFIYGSSMLAVRMGPVRHDFRATLAVMVGLVGVMALAGAISSEFQKFLQNEFWYILTYTLGLLLLLLFFTLVIGGVVKLVLIFSNKGQGRAPKSSSSSEE